jgi:hypothetical protein
MMIVILKNVKIGGFVKEKDLSEFREEMFRDSSLMKLSRRSPFIGTLYIRQTKILITLYTATLFFGKVLECRYRF